MENTRINEKIPMISVVIPTYNRAQYVILAIESVLTQTFTNYEIIVIDDGSTDNTRNVLQSYMSQIRYIYQQNKGVSAARNTGIIAAKGEWIAFLDSDDEWLPHKLELQMKDLHRYPKAVLSCTNVLFEGPDGIQPMDYFATCLSVNLQQTKFITEPLFCKPYAWTSTVIARYEGIMSVGLFDEELSIYEDADLFYRLSTIGGFVVNPSTLATAFRRNESKEINLSVAALKDKKKNYISLVKIFSKLLNLDLTVKQQSFVKQKLSWSWFDLGIVQYNLQNTNQARRCFIASFRANPTRRNLVKLFLGFSGSLGINYIEKKRSAAKGFRRSDYYK